MKNDKAHGRKTISGYANITNERGEGGGLMTYWQEKEKYGHLNTERQWILMGINYQNFATCNVFSEQKFPSTWITSSSTYYY